ncbi:hypothetical protein [Streptomyces orinoci]|uniref:Uncharacterized protein n=1 Tax=Streptomyces orinoci TaxID=67339 RepID=A0ABV3JZD9_STRON|nr:hypothetical protein [Streptomyces orinoci]
MTNKRSEAERQRRRELYDTMAGVISPLDDLALAVALTDLGVPIAGDELLKQPPGGDVS